MSYLCNLDKSYRVLNNTEEFKGWSSTYTLLGILRAAEHFLDFTWMRLLYEGGDMGEGIIKTLRPLSPTGIREGWAYLLIQNYYRKNVMKHLIITCKNDHTFSVAPYENLLDSKQFVRYGSKVVIRNKIKTDSVLSVLYYKHKTTNSTVIASMILQVQTWYLCVINIISPENSTADIEGYTYFQICLSDDDYKIKDQSSKIINENEMILWKVGLALPCYWKNSYLNYFCFVTNDGYTLNSILSISNKISCTCTTTTFK